MRSMRAPGEVHDRMPAFLFAETYDDWLGDQSTIDDLLAVLDCSSLKVADGLSNYLVSTAVNSIKNDGAPLLQSS